MGEFFFLSQRPTLEDTVIRFQMEGGEIGSERDSSRSSAVQVLSWLSSYSNSPSPTLVLCPHRTLPCISASFSVSLHQPLHSLYMSNLPSEHFPIGFHQFSWEELSCQKPHWPGAHLWFSPPE